MLSPTELYNHYIMRKLILLIILGIFLLPQSTLAYRVPERDYWRAYALKLINTSREANNLPLLGLDERLNEVAKLHAQDTVLNFNDDTLQSRRESYLAHVSSDKRELADRLRDHGLLDDIKAAAENVGFRLRGPIEIIHELTKEALDLMHDGMMAEVPPDDGHRRTILGDYTHVGIGIEFHKDLSNEINTLFIVADYAKFPHGTIVRIPEVGSPPAPLLVSDLNEEEEEEPATVTRRRTRVRTSIDARKRRFSNTPDESQKIRIATPQTGSSWLERNRSRIEARRSERLQRLLKRVEERRRKRLERLLDKSTRR